MSSNPVQNDRVDNIILLRGIASMGLCAVHIVLATQYVAGNFFDEIIKQGQTGVQLFFIISGFVIPYSFYRKNYGITDFFHFLVRRNLRIDPPAWLIMGVIAVLTLLGTQVFDPLNFFCNLFYLVPFVPHTDWYDTVFWTLGIELQYYVIIGLLYPVLIKIPVKLLVPVLVFYFMLSHFFPFGNPREYIGGSLVFFILGYILFLTYVRKLSFIAGSLILVLMCAWLFKMVAIRYGLLSLMSVVFVLFVPPIRFFLTTYLGKISYSLYLTHVLCIRFFIAFIAGRYAFTPFMSSSILVVLCVIFAGLFHWAVEWPSMRLAKTVRFSKAVAVNRADA